MNSNHDVIQKRIYACCTHMIEFPDQGDHGYESAEQEMIAIGEYLYETGGVLSLIEKVISVRIERDQYGGRIVSDTQRLISHLCWNLWSIDHYLDHQGNVPLKSLLLDRSAHGYQTHQ
jgi:hypothetical protein